jgi:glycerol-3-phosphate dehydrogenase (NAD(P)+)
MNAMPDIQPPENIKIGVVGAGSWGTALANLLALKGYAIDLWAYEKEVAEQIQAEKENRLFLPDIKLSPNLRATHILAEAVSGKDLILLVVPSHVMRQTAEQLTPHILESAVLVSASKGIENKTHLTMTGVLKACLPKIPASQLGVLSGPSFAREVAQMFPTAVTAASEALVVAELIQNVFATPFFRVYTNDDVIGVELGGSVKNVIAIAAGVIDGLGLGFNTRAALITRGQTEIRRLGIALGANPRTFTGLAGIGDLILTCTASLSRNYTVGIKIGKGMKLNEILAEMRMVAEGVKNARSVYNLSRKIGVEMPISHEMYHILYDDLPPKEAVYRLMTRELKHELDEE